MKPIGFSTGALAKGDFATGLAVQRDVPRIDAVELSALRDHELPLLVDAIPSLDLDRFEYVSFLAVQVADTGRTRGVRSLPRVARLVAGHRASGAVADPVALAPRGEHLPLGATTRQAFARVVHLVPADCPLIIESIIPPELIESELDTVSAL